MKRFRFVLLVSVLLLSSVEIFATAQYPDKIIFKGKEYMLHSNPMEVYFAKFRDKRPKIEIRSTALWRGYVATFEVIDDALYLKDIHIQVRKKDSEMLDTEWKSAINEVFPGDKKLKIDWFTGLLVLPHGEMVNYVHMGYFSTYENYILLEIEAGNFKKSKEFDYKEYEKFRARQFEAFKKTDEYKKIFEDIRKKENANPEFIDKYLKSFIVNYTSKILVD